MMLQRFFVYFVGLAGICFANSLHVKRDTCQPQPTGAGPVPSPDTADNFLNGPVPANAASSLSPPDGFSLEFQGLKCGVELSSYIGYALLDSFDPAKCAAICQQTSGCTAFNMFMERDPSVDPDPTDCPNPPSTTNYKCVMFDPSLGPIQSNQCRNTGQWRASFQVVITNSIAYNRNPTSGTVWGWDYTRTGNTTVKEGSYHGDFIETFTSAAPASVALSSSCRNPPPSAHLALSGHWMTTGDASACTLYVQGQAIAPGTPPPVYPYNPGDNYFQVEVNYGYATLKVDCPQGASGVTYKITSVQWNRDVAGSYPTRYQYTSAC